MKSNYMPLGSINNKLCVLIILLTGIFFNACQNNPEKFTLGEEYVESQTKISLVDTFSVSLSTVILDDMPTSATETILVGHYRDDTFGEINSHSYMQFDIPANVDLQTDENYDSLNLVLKFNNYSFGDTTKSQQISVYPLTERIEFDDENEITSESSFQYDPNPIGSIVYTPEPNNSVDTLSIKINDDIGLDLFTKMSENSDVLTDTERFLNYFNGLVLRADNVSDEAIVGFYGNESDVKLILHTSKEAETSTQTYNYEFNLYDPTLQFNNITHDFFSTKLSGLTDQENELASAETGGVAFLQGGTGLAIRLDLPSLGEILMRDSGEIMDAKLSISPLKNSYKNVELPTELVLYEIDKLNRKCNYVYNNGGAVVTSSLFVDEQYHENTVYLFDITKYLKDELADSYVDPEKGLLITLPPGYMESTFYRSIIDAKSNNTKLEIYYLSY